MYIMHRHYSPHSISMMLCYYLQRFWNSKYFLFIYLNNL